MMHLPFSPTGVCQHTQFFARPSPPLAPANHEAGPARRGRHAKRAPTGRISWHAGRHLSLGQGIGSLSTHLDPSLFWKVMHISKGDHLPVNVVMISIESMTTGRPTLRIGGDG